MLNIAASVSGNSDFCIKAHIELAQRLGMTDEMLGELMEIVALANGANNLGAGYGVEPERDNRTPNGGHVRYWDGPAAPLNQQVKVE